MSSRKGVSAAGMFFLVGAVGIMVLMFLLVAIGAKVGFVKVQQDIQISLELVDKSRMVSTLLLSGADKSNMELLGSSVASGFDRTGLEGVRKTLKSMGMRYLGIKAEELKDIEGTPSGEGFTTDVPLPGAGKASEGIKARVTAG